MLHLKLQKVKIFNQPAEKNRAKPEKQKGKKEEGWGEGIFALLRLELERFRFPLIKRKPKQKIFHLLLKEKNGGRKNKKCNEKISVLVRRSEAEASGNAPIRLPRSTSVKLSSEPPRTRRVISRGSVQKKLEFQPKGTANLEFQSFWKFYASVVRSPRLRARLKGLILQRFATLRVVKKKCFGFGFGSSFWRSQSKTKFCNQSFFVSPLAKLGSDNF